MAVREFALSGEHREVASFKLSDQSTEIFTVTIERKRLTIATENEKFEARANTISALPSGTRCGCCNGTGRS